jgi:uncharacterized protein YigA (DUF484 family)
MKKKLVTATNTSKMQELRQELKENAIKNDSIYFQLKELKKGFNNATKLVTIIVTLN